jgi:redox-sensitive bicupin YhaK (pirin superfamily)
MSNIKLIIEERASNIGNFMVGRLLPFRQKRAVGPFVFVDHMGPVVLEKNENLDVPLHPHIGLSTLTYLIEGSIFHKDSIGSAIEITPGAVNWMTAGQGVVHSERTPDRLRNQKKTLHGLQIWVALPKDKEEISPSFTHVSSSDVPAWIEGELSFKLIAGELMGRKSPVPVYSQLYFLEIKSNASTIVNLKDKLFGESALYILEGGISSDGNHFESKQLLVAREAELCTFEMKPRTTVYVFGGEPFPEERFIHWNFVHSDKDKIEQAKQDWVEGRFPKIEGEMIGVKMP